MIRDGHEPKDIQLNFLRLFQKLKADAVWPWDEWSYIEGYPQQKFFSIPDPLIYFEPAFHLGYDRESQGGHPGDDWSLKIGAWDENKSGGINRIQTIQGKLLELIKKKKELNEVLYNIDYYGISYTDTNLNNQGIGTGKLAGPTWIKNDVGNNAFRIEFDLQITT